ncbi:hypothetical protein AB4Z29_31335 [Paenibacillus sp. 2TAB23]|uniref:hypothetical protein n=1 Tax=Paenibacillus sp. 2TAB23 TaxID=3233004 RepID=UPI003F9D2365
MFPELRHVFKILTCTSAIAIAIAISTLRSFPFPKEISRLTTSSGNLYITTYFMKKKRDPPQLRLVTGRNSCRGSTLLVS